MNTTFKERERERERERENHSYAHIERLKLLDLLQTIHMTTEVQFMQIKYIKAPKAIA